MFKNDLRVTIQAMDGNQKDKVIEMLNAGVRLIPKRIQNDQTFQDLLDSVPILNLKTNKLASG